MTKTHVKVAIAMSGGVDSSVAALLLQQAGYDVFGITMHHYDETILPGKVNDLPLFTSIDDARSVCERLDIPHYSVDIREEFARLIIQNFEDEYFIARTPNPCVRCNPLIKWTVLRDRANDYGATHFATGHYASVIYRQSDDRFLLKMGLDRAKDQSYVLWGLTQDHLRNTMLPLGEYTKKQVRELATKYHLETSHKQDSQEICFISDNDYPRFLESRHPEKIASLGHGEIVDMSGKRVGYHKGYPFYTIGQRKKLGLALNQPVYVVHIDAGLNRVVIGDKQDLQARQLMATQTNWIAVECLSQPMKVLTRIRYNDPGRMATIYPEPDRTIRVVFEQVAEAVTPGQSVVFYADDLLVGGGIIRS